jgi:hypothetical protein
MKNLLPPHTTNPRKICLTAWGQETMDPLKP